MELYPKWLYHKSNPAIIVQNEDEHKALGKEYQEIPFPIDDANETEEEPNDNEKPQKKTRAKKQ